MRSRGAAPKYQRSYNVHWEVDSDEQPYVMPDPSQQKVLPVHGSQVMAECDESIRLGDEAYRNRQARQARRAEEELLDMEPVMRECVESIVHAYLKWRSHGIGVGYRLEGNRKLMLQFLSR